MGNTKSIDGAVILTILPEVDKHPVMAKARSGPKENRVWLPEEVARLHQICREQLSSQHNVVLICGAGVTMSQYGADASWAALLKSGVQFACDNNVDPSAVGAMQASLDKPDATTDDWLRVGQALLEALSRAKLLDLWLRDAVEDRFIEAQGALPQVLARCAKLSFVRLATTNYDFLLERAMGWTHGNPDLPGFTWREAGSAIDWQRGARKQVYHLHGHARDSESIVLGSRSYADLNEDPWVKNLRTAMVVTDTVFFVGCGATLQDPAFRAIFEGELGPVHAVNRNRLWFQLVTNDESVGHPRLNALPYGRDHNDLPVFIENCLLPWLKGTAAKKPPAGNDDEEPPPDTLPGDAERIEQTRRSLLLYLEGKHFSGIESLKFADDGLPSSIHAVFESAKTNPRRVSVAESCVHGILKFARELVDCLEDIPATSPAVTAKRKGQFRARLINAMQEAILLGARLERLPEKRILAAYDSSSPCELEVASWLSVSVMLRERLADHLRADFPEGQPVVFKDADHLEIRGEVELGTFANTNPSQAKNQAQKAVWRLLYPAAPAFPDSPSDNKIKELQGDLIGKKEDGKHVIATFDKKSGELTSDFIKWLNDDLHVGVVTITANDGVFDLYEGTWKARLAALLKTLRKFERKRPSAPSVKGEAVRSDFGF